MSWCLKLPHCPSLNTFITRSLSSTACMNLSSGRRLGTADVLFRLDTNAQLVTLKENRKNKKNHNQIEPICWEKNETLVVLQDTLVTMYYATCKLQYVCTVQLTKSLIITQHTVTFARNQKSTSTNDWPATKVPYFVWLNKLIFLMTVYPKLKMIHIKNI